VALSGPHGSLGDANGSRECAPDDRLRDEAIQSRVRGPGLLRGACHPAALCADRVARNDGAGTQSDPRGEERGNAARLEP